MKRIRPTTLVFGSAAIVIVAISVLLTLRRGDAATRSEPAPFSGSRVVQHMSSLLADARLAQRVPVVVVRDESAASFYGDGAVLDSIVGAWRDALTAVGADVRVLDAASAKTDRVARVLVVPSSPCMTVETREAIDAVTTRGGGVVLTSLAGYFDAACRPIGYGLVVQSTGAFRADTLEPRPMVYVTLPAGNPLTVDIPPGSRLDLDPARQVALRHPVRDAFYSDYALQPMPAGARPLLDAAITHARVGAGRLVYWGFELRDAVRRPWNRAVLRLLVRNTVTWAAGLPVVSVEPWPHGRRAAASITQDVESGFTNAKYALDSLRAAGVRSTYFLTSNIAARHERLSREMANAGEIGTHTENHRLLGGTPLNVQRRRLIDTERELTHLFGLPVDGLRPPQEQFDMATMRAWIDAGGRYVFGANDSRTASPELLPIGKDTLVLIGRVASDDIAAVGAGHDDADAVAKLFIGEYERLRALGGLYVLSYHSQVLARPELVPALATLARALVADTALWLATTGEIAEWWRGRAQLAVTARSRDDGIDIAVRNQGERLVRGAVIRVELPAPPAHPIAGATAALLPSPTSIVRLLIPPVPGNSVRTYAVDYVGAKRPAATRQAKPKPARRSRPRFWWFPWWR